MKKILLLFLLFTCGSVKAQEDTLSTITLNISQDSFLGFYLSGIGSTPISNNLSLTLYGNYWTNPAFGNASVGTDFWTELGAGVCYTFLNGQAYINPTMGFTYGKLLSGGEKGVLGDGIVPGIAAGFAGNRLDLNGTLVFYRALRKQGPVHMDLRWWFVAPGYKFNNKYTAGLHVEELAITRITESTPQRLFMWVGPYIQFNIRNGAFLKAAGGFDAVNKSFIKLNLSIPLLGR